MRSRNCLLSRLCGFDCIGVGTQPLRKVSVVTKTLNNKFRPVVEANPRSIESLVVPMGVGNTSLNDFLRSGVRLEITPNKSFYKCLKRG